MNWYPKLPNLRQQKSNFVEGKVFPFYYVVLLLNKKNLCSLVLERLKNPIRSLGGKPIMGECSHEKEIPFSLSTPLEKTQILEY